MPRLLLVLLFLLSWVSPLGASQIDIRSQHMEVLEQEKIAVFSGKVKARKGDLRIWADRLYVYYRTVKGKREVVKLIALGNVRIEKGPWRSLSGKAVYFRKDDRLVLEDHPRVWHGKDEVRGAVVIIYFRDDRSEVLSRPGQPVEAYVYTD